MLPLFALAQRKPYGSIHIKSADNTTFYLELDGKRINQQPLSEVLVTKLPNLQYSVKIISASDESMTFEREKFYVCNKEKEFKAFDYKLSTVNKKLKFKFLSMKPYKYQPVIVDDNARFDLSGKMEKSIAEIKPKIKVKKEKKAEEISENIVAEKSDSASNKKAEEPKINKTKKAKTVKTEKDSSGYVQNNQIDKASDSLKTDKPIAKPKATKTKKDTLSQNVSLVKTSPKKDSSAVKSVKADEKKKTITKDSSLAVLKKTKTTNETKSDSLATPVKTKTAKPQKDSGMMATKNTKVVPAQKKEKVDLVKNKGKQKAMETEIPEEQKPLKDLVLVEPADWACDHGWPMHKANFDRMLDSISIQSTDIEKIKKAKELALKNCLITDQIFEIGSKIEQDELRFEWFKFAYKYTIDIVNYSKLGVLLKEEKQRKQFYYFITH